MADSAFNWTLSLIGPAIKGSSVEHPGEIVITPPSLSVSRTFLEQEDTHETAAEGRPQLEDISFAKEWDLSTPSLVLACCRGTKFAEAIFTGWTTINDRQEAVMVITLKAAPITSHDLNGDGDCDLTMTYDSLGVTYRDLDTEGKQIGRTMIEWQRKTGTAKQES